MATEIGRLVSIFEADTRKFDSALKASEERIKSLKANIASIKTDDIGFKPQRLAALNDLLKKATAEHKALSAAQKEAAASSRAMGQDLSTALSTVAPRLAGLAGMAGPLSAIAAGLVAITGAAAGAAVGIFDLVKSTSEATGHFVDLSQQVGFSVETLSALSNAAETSGGSINTVVAALGIFERNMVEAQDSSTEMSKVFKQLSIDTSDNEKALRQALEILSKFPPGAERTALAMKLFGRSGREVSAIMDEMGGTLDAYMEIQRRANTLIGTDAAKAGDKLTDSLIEMNRQFDAVQRLVASAFAPTVLKAITDVTTAIDGNKKELMAWKDNFELAASGAYALANAVGAIATAITGLSGMSVPSIITALASFGVMGGPGVFAGLRAFGASQRIPAGTQSTIVNQMKALQGSPLTQATRNPLAALDRSTLRSLNLGGGGGGGGGGGRGRAAKQERDEFAELLKRQQRELGGLAATTEVARTALELLDDKYKKLTASQRDEILTVARQIDIERQRIALQNEIKSFMDNQNKSIRDLSENLNSNLGRTDAQIHAWERMGAVIPETITWWARFNATVLDSVDAADKYREALEGVIIELGQVPEFDPAAMGLGQKLEDLLGPPPADRSEELLRIRQQAEELASDLTGIFDRALYDGISGGAKKGLQSLALGFLDMIQQIILGKLKAALADALSGIGSGGGGGFLSGLGKALLGGIIGGAAGGVGGGTHGGGTIGTGGKVFGRASGGAIYAGSPYLVGERGPEWVIPNQNATVLPHGRQPGNNITINIAIPPETKGSYNPKLSARQQAEMFAAAIQSRLR